LAEASMDCSYLFHRKFSLRSTLEGLEVWLEGIYFLFSTHNFSFENSARSSSFCVIWVCLSSRSGSTFRKENILNLWAVRLLVLSSSMLFHASFISLGARCYIYTARKNLLACAPD
jgi:hypothetical protein